MSKKLRRLLTSRTPILAIALVVPFGRMSSCGSGDPNGPGQDCPRFSMVSPNGPGELSAEFAVIDVGVGDAVNMQVAAMLPSRWGEVSATLVDEEGLPVFMNEEPLVFSADDEASLKAEDLSPTDASHYWVGFSAPVVVGPDDGFAGPRTFRLQFELGVADEQGPESVAILVTAAGFSDYEMCTAIVNGGPTPVLDSTWGMLKAIHSRPSFEEES